MPKNPVLNQEAVLKAIEEFDRLGREVFLTTYKFGKAKRYFLVHNGKQYDSKAIYGRAFGYAHKSKSLTSSDFSGGEKQVAGRLRELGFNVEKGLVGLKGTPQGQQTFLLTWNPNNWRWDALPATVAATRSGRRVADQWSCVNAHGQVGDRVYLLKVGKQRGLMASGRATTVPFEAPHWDDRRAGAGKTIRYIKLEWERVLAPDAEALLDPSSFSSPALDKVHWKTQSSGILVAAEAAHELELIWRAFTGAHAVPTLPPLTTVTLQSAPKGKSLLRPVAGLRPGGTGTRGSGKSRRSPVAKVVGDRAELLVVAELKRMHKQRLRHHAANGETPGYDISFWEEGKLIAIEVKGTTADTFPNFELTQNEKQMADSMRADYQVWLVARADSRSPHYEVLEDPAKRLESGELIADPSVWRIERSGTEAGAVRASA